MRRFLIVFGLGGIAGGVIGFALGIYLLPILTAEKGISTEQVTQIIKHSERSGIFKRDLKDSDSFHWGVGNIALSTQNGQQFFTLDGELSPGPDYKLYLIPRYVETEVEFLAIKAQSIRVANVSVFENFHIPVPTNINTDAYPAVLIWCEAFGQFITAARLQ